MEMYFLVRRMCCDLNVPSRSRTEATFAKVKTSLAIFRKKSSIVRARLFHNQFHLAQIFMPIYVVSDLDRVSLLRIPRNLEITLLQETNKFFT